MKKYILFLSIIFIFFFLFRAPDTIYASDIPSMLSDQQNQGGTDKDRDKDGLITYGELSIETRKLLKQGYSAGLRNRGLGIEMIYVAEDPVVR